MPAQSSYSVELKKSGKTLSMEPGLRLLDVLLEAGRDIDHSCREGVCDSCETRVVEDEIDHHDGVLTKTERAAKRSMMVCISGCKNRRLVRDL
ncbi:Ferredoxin [Pseudomonas sp. LAMO17WK12:I10]|nr:2Fe-2S iron-sulfur cluster protein [Pseudomonas sp. LAMO17WK12:I9]SNY17139.1 Ferredoxin [Pseudomonas sp. LAMO17WK12:I10]